MFLNRSFSRGKKDSDIIWHNMLYFILNLHHPNKIYFSNQIPIKIIVNTKNSNTDNMIKFHKSYFNKNNILIPFAEKKTPMDNLFKVSFLWLVSTRLAQISTIYGTIFKTQKYRHTSPFIFNFCSFVVKLNYRESLVRFNVIIRGINSLSGLWSYSKSIITISGGQLKRTGSRLVPSPRPTIIFLPSSSIRPPA